MLVGLRKLGTAFRTGGLPTSKRVGDLPQVFVWLTEPLGAVHAVLNAAPVDGVVVLVVQ